MTHRATAATTRRVADAVAPAVVRIGRHGGRGCGVVVADGLVVTNAHNLRDRTTQVTFADGRALQARATGIDADGDLTVLAVDTGGIAAPAWADDPPAEGMPCTRWPPSPAAAGSPRAPSRRSTARSAAPGAGWSPAPSSTPRHWPGARPAARWSTPRAGWSASPRCGWATGSRSPSPPGPNCGDGSTPWRRATSPGAGAWASAWRRHGWRRRLRAAVGLPERDGRAGARRRRRQRRRSGPASPPAT